MAGSVKDVTLGSDAFFPFSDNIERAHKSGVEVYCTAGWIRARRCGNRDL